MQAFDDDRKLINFCEFYNLFFSFVKDGKTQKQSYELAEERYFAFFGQRKYSSYNSFYIVARDKLSQKK